MIIASLSNDDDDDDDDDERRVLELEQEPDETG